MEYTFDELKNNPFEKTKNEIENKLLLEFKDKIEFAIFNKEQDKIYGDVVNFLIRKKYSSDKVEAIINNYLDDSTNADHYKEFIDLQAYRKEAKAKAKELLGM